MALRLFERGRGKVVGQMELADGNFHVDAEVVLAAENFEDAAARILRGRGPVRDLDIDDQAFEIVPVRVERGLVTEHAIDRFLLALAWNSRTPLRSGRYSMPGGITISCVILLSIGFT